jgi:hypothetical protein
LKKISVTVNDKMQKGYRYFRTCPPGRDFDPEFRPELTPKQMLALGVFGGKYMTDCRMEFPADWFKRARLCPETSAMRLMRNPQGRQQYDNIFFRDHCKELLRVPMLMVKEFVKNNYRLTCFLGLENSPTCGIHWGKHKVNRYQTESPNPVDKPGPSEPVLAGIMAEILSEELAKEGIKAPFLEFPALSPADSDKRNKFWEDLRKAVEPDAAPGPEDGPGGHRRPRDIDGH